MTTPSVPGIYIAIVTSDDLVPVTRDKRYIDCCARVNSKNIKIGKAENLAARERDYWNDFDQDKVVFIPIAQTTEIRVAETAILRKLAIYRKSSPKNGRMDWLENVTREHVIAEIFEALSAGQIPYVRLCGSVGEA